MPRQRAAPQPEPTEEVELSDPLRDQIEIVIDELVFNPAPRRQGIQKLFDQVATKEGASRASVSQSKDPESSDFPEQMDADMRLGDLLTTLVCQVRTELAQKASIKEETEIEPSKVVATARSVLQRMLKPKKDHAVRGLRVSDQAPERQLSMTS